MCGIAGFIDTSIAPDTAGHGTKLVERRITDDDGVKRVARASAVFDGPSQLAISMLAEEARAEVTVVLAGDGGDEGSGGYSWYEQFGRGWSIHQRMGRPLRSMTAVGCDLASRVGAVERLSPASRERLLVDEPRLAAMLRPVSPSEFYASLRSEFTESVEAASGLQHPPGSVVAGASVPAFEVVQDIALFIDSRSFLPQHPLTKVDRTTMAVGLAARPPSLDPTVSRDFERSASHPAIATRRRAPIGSVRPGSTTRNRSSSTNHEGPARNTSTHAVRGTVVHVRQCVADRFDLRRWSVERGGRRADRSR